MASVPRNIELFDRVVAVTLVKLYESFPNPLDINATGIGYEAAQGASADEIEAFKLMTETAENSIHFLVREGFVRYNETARTFDGAEFPGASLTLRGFTLLGATPTAVNESVDRRPFIEQLKGAVQEGAKAAIPEIIKSLFAGAIGLGSAAIGAG